MEAPASIMNIPFLLANAATPLLAAAHAAITQYWKPISRRGKPDVPDHYLFERAGSGQIDSSDLVRFLKREMQFWPPLSNLQNRARLHEVILILNDELQHRQVPLLDTPAEWTRLVTRGGQLKWTKGILMKRACLSMLWLYMPETVIRWEPKQCVGLMSRRLYSGKTPETEAEALSFVKGVDRDRVDRAYSLQWALAAARELNGGERYPFPAVLHDRLLSFEGQDEWRRYRLLASMLVDAKTREWFTRHLNEFSVRPPTI